jgi:aryl-alcohol dehydrogenase-like predicted oxidoreductase
MISPVVGPVVWPPQTPEKTKLGQQGLIVSPLGLGCMGMSHGYGQPDDHESLRVLHRSLELGIDFWDTAEIYGPFTNEELLGRALKSFRRDQVKIATKFAWTFSADGERDSLNSSPAHIKKTVETSLQRLKTDYIDLYYQHRLDPNTPIEETVGAMSDLVKAGKIRYVGLSEVGPDIIRRAHAVHPLTCVQSEYSLWERGVEKDVLPTLHELGIGFVPYSPMGRGLLTGTIQKPDDLQAGDSRHAHPRFQGENLRKNLELVEDVRRIAEKINATPTQVALAWLLRQGEHHRGGIVPIPGTKRIKYLEENAKAASLQIPDELWIELQSKLDQFRAAGTRYPDSGMKLVHDSRSSKVSI